MIEEDKNLLSLTVKSNDSCCSNTSCCGTKSPIKRVAKKIGRNELCPCGSGRKFKKCCG